MNKPKNKISAEATKFNADYNDLAAEAKLIQEQLEQSIDLAKKLGKKAQKLYDYGNKKCYDENYRPIKGINKLLDKMDELEFLVSAYTEIQDIAEDFNVTK